MLEGFFVNVAIWGWGATVTLLISLFILACLYVLAGVAFVSVAAGFFARATILLAVSANALLLFASWFMPVFFGVAPVALWHLFLMISRG
jgi:hypothetical protein